jgi:hypothetical protein
MFKIPNYITIFTYTFHGLWLYLLMNVKHLGMFGLGLSRSITEGLSAISLLALIKFKGYFQEL